MPESHQFCEATQTAQCPAPLELIRSGQLTRPLIGVRAGGQAEPFANISSETESAEPLQMKRSTSSWGVMVSLHTVRDPKATSWTLSSKSARPSPSVQAGHPARLGQVAGSERPSVGRSRWARKAPVQHFLLAPFVFADLVNRTADDSLPDYPSHPMICLVATSASTIGCGTPAFAAHIVFPEPFQKGCPDSNTMGTGNPSVCNAHKRR